MNLYSAAIDTLRGFVARYRAARVVEKRIYVFILVPFNFSKNGDASKAEIAQGLINGHSDFDRAANYTLAAPLSRGEIRGAVKTTGDGDVDDDPQLDFRLMWTWFLPNPLWPPNKSKCKL